MRKKTLILTIISTLLLARSTPVYAEAVENTETMSAEELIESLSTDSVDEGLYVTEMTFFYADPEKKDYYGMLKAGSIISPILETEDMYQIKYSGKDGYIEKAKTSPEIPFRPITLEDGQQVKQSYATLWEQIFPVSHYFDSMDQEANESLNLFLMDEEDDDYIYIGSGENAMLNAYVPSTAYGVEVPYVRIYYCENKDTENPVFYIEAAAEDVSPDDVYNIEFAYNQGEIQFPHEFGHDFVIGIRADESTHIYVDNRLTDAGLEDGYLRFTTGGHAVIAVENMPNKVVDADSETETQTSTESVKETETKTETVAKEVIENSVENNKNSITNQLIEHPMILYIVFGAICAVVVVLGIYLMIRKSRKH